MSISLHPELGDRIREAASRSGKPLSGWMAEAADAKLRAEALADYLSDYERRQGELSVEEVREAARELGLESRT